MCGSGGVNDTDAQVISIRELFAGTRADAASMLSEFEGHHTATER